MKMTLVRREQFTAIGYDPILKELRIEFKIGIYTYTEILPVVKVFNMLTSW